MPNIPSAPNALPSVITEVVTATRASSVPGGTRIAAIIGEGARSEVIISSAVGGGSDGLDPTYTSVNGSDGRHFALTFAPVISNRTSLFRNGLPLVGLEATIDLNAFNSAYDYRIDIATGHIEMQRAHILDQGGTQYTSGSTNVGKGTLNSTDGYNTVHLLDVNAPTETWTIKCVLVQRNNLNQPIAGTAQFVAFGTVSGNVLDANGNPTIWVANGQTYSNGTLSFNISETSPAFREGDYFIVKVVSGVMVKNDSLTATYIAVADVNDPTFFDSLSSITTKHGSITLNNTLSLGSFLAFQNGTPGIMANQAAPALPRRSSYILETNFPGTSVNLNDFIIPFPLGVVPDLNSQVHIFVTNTTTKVETQLLANKFPYYTLGTAGQPTVNQFVFSNAAPPSGNSFSYSVIQQNAAISFALDGYINRDLTTQTNATFSSASVSFNSSYVGKTLTVFDAANLANNGSFNIVAASGGSLSIVANAVPPFSDFINEGSATFHLVNSVTGATVPSTTGTLSIVASPNTATATVTSSISLTAFAPFVNGYKVQITSATNASNIGLFDITSFTPSSTLTIAKSFVSEHSLKFEVIDASQVSSYLVLNHNIVPNSNDLRVTLVDQRDASFYDAGWVNALASLETQEIDILVTLPRQTISVIFQNALNHCITMSSPKNKKERVLLLGAIQGLTPDNLTGAKLVAVEDIGVLEGIQGDSVAEILAGNTEDLANYSVSAAYGNTFRAMYFFPDQIVAQVGSQNQFLDGFYVAAAAAGKFSGESFIAMPLTNKTLSGFTILKNRMFSQTVLEKLAGFGVAIVQPVSGGGKVLNGITTTQSGFPEEEEMSIVFIRDRISKSMRTGFAGFIGQPEDPDMVATLMARAMALLNGFIGQRIITDWTGLSVKRDSVDPRQWNIGVQVQPNYPVNWIYIQVGVGVI